MHVLRFHLRHSNDVFLEIRSFETHKLILDYCNQASFFFSWKISFYVKPVFSSKKHHCYSLTFDNLRSIDSLINTSFKSQYWRHLLTFSGSRNMKMRVQSGFVCLAILIPEVNEYSFCKGCNHQNNISGFLLNWSSYRNRQCSKCFSHLCGGGGGEEKEIRVFKDDTVL